MLRQLLAAFIMLTGLGAVAAPVQARVVDVENVGQAQLQDAGCVLHARSAAAGYSWSLDRPDSARMCPRPRIVVMLPPLMLQVDRAHE
ncbi:conserved hypothetical protein [Altererythrobacter sp. B11]|uniref:hypothetical protein n=1 Tax=Altererythrobacter sp. B11 TaxID=2060312 RepID=UPI000DC70973|nr:hypothetical protein [Altererythrobacter sp. B11]BBC72881.1 conserved hypothetical protein [Altererythrobacter sp. B11]